MNFYTLTFKKHSPKRWTIRSIIGVAGTIAFLFAFNYIIDPYNITKYNLLDIKYKFARDDRTEKLNYFKILPRFDTILIGSSRVYSINPRTASKILGGTAYNFGVGTATVEDHLGILLYLEREKKLPKTLIIGVDFYTFNPDIPLNSYFLANKELNFLSFSGRNPNEYWSKFLSMDATRASVKTLKNHLMAKNEKPRFDSLGWGLFYVNNTLRNMAEENIITLQEIQQNKTLLYSDYRYKHIDSKRIAYYENIRNLCKKHHIRLYIFTTPLHPLLLKELNTHTDTYNALNEFVRYFSTYENFTNFYTDTAFTSNLYNFGGATHTTANAGDLILEKILTKPKP